MKHVLKLKHRTKKPKPVAIQNYKVSYLDKRSKMYHRIVMTAFAGLFGMAGLVFVFGAAAVNTTQVNQSNTANILLIVGIILCSVAVGGIVYILGRKK